MKNTIKYTAIGMMIFLITLITTHDTYAQQRGQQGPPPQPNDEQIEQMVEDLTKELDLTENQEKQVSEKYFAHFDEVENKLEAGRPDRKEMESLKSDFEKDVKSVLTDDQKDQYTTYLKQDKQQRPPK